MPELPEVEAVCRRIRPRAVGRVIIGAEVLRPSIVRPQDARTLEEKVTGLRIDKIERLGKNILIHLGAQVLHVHLRMTGNLNVIPKEENLPESPRVILHLDDGASLVFTDSRCLGKIHLYDSTHLPAALSKLGPEPLSRSFTANRFAEAAGASSQPAKIFLMDQRRVAGLGNIYAAEALFAAGIHPVRKVNGLTGARVLRLHAAIVETLRQAVKAVAAEYKRPGYWGGEPWDFPLQVYDREGEPCRVCGRTIRRLKQGGRSTYFCPGCQR